MTNHIERPCREDGGICDLQENLIYCRRLIKTSPSGGFMYVLHRPHTNYVEYGLGWESSNALQRKHVPTDVIHELQCYAVSNELARGESNESQVAHLLQGRWSDTRRTALPKSVGVQMKLTPALSEIFFHHRDGDSYVLSNEDRQWLAEAIREVHDEAWGNPAAWEPEIVQLGDGRCVWAMYDDDADRIRVGLGMYDENNEPVLGDNSYILNKEFAADFVVKLWQGQVVFFFSVPPRFPAGFDRIVDNGASLKAIAKAVLKLSDTVWPGVLADPEEEE